MLDPANTPIMLVDGSSYLYRAFYAAQKINCKSDNGTIFLITNMFKSLLRDYPGRLVIVVFDADGKNFRHKLYKKYKANRQPMPDNLRSQVQSIHDIIQVLGMFLLIIEGVEADDVIGTLARKATEKKIDTVILTSDKDMAQLVSEHVALINTINNSKMDLDGVVKKFGIPAHLIVDYLALSGDSSDNIPGMPGVGKKTALAVLQGIGCIDDIIRNLDKIMTLQFRGSKNFATKFEEHREIILLSRDLATIKTDVVLPVSIEGLKAGFF